MKELYKVTVEYYVMAEDEKDAESIYPNHIQNCTVFAYRAGQCCCLDWWDAIPFGSEDNRTCGDIILGKEEQCV